MNKVFYVGQRIAILPRNEWAPEALVDSRILNGKRYPRDTVGSIIDVYDNAGGTYGVMGVRYMGKDRNGDPAYLVQLDDDHGCFWYNPNVMELINDFHSKHTYLPGEYVWYNEDVYLINTIYAIDDYQGEIAYELTRYTDNSYSSAHSEESMTPYEGDFSDIPVRRCCNRCGRIFTFDDTIVEEDRYLCPECRERRYVAAYGRFKPHLNYYTLDGVKSTYSEVAGELLLGTEIEVRGGGEEDANAARVMDVFSDLGLKNFVYVTHDGSLRNPNGDFVDGFEIVTKPATVDFHQSISEEYSKVFKDLVRMGYRAHNTTCCGLHVHVNRGYFGDDEDECVYKLLCLMDKFWNEIQIFSRRDPDSLNSYARRVTYDFDDYMDQYNKCQDDHSGHYFGLNIMNENTVEFRVFKGTLNVRTYLLTLRFVAKMAEVAKTATVRQLNELKFEDLLDEEGLEYYNQRVALLKFDEE